MAELLKHIVEGGKQLAAGTRKLAVVGGGDGKPVPLSIMPDHTPPIASLAHIELEAVAALGKRIFEGSERVFNEYTGAGVRHAYIAAATVA